MGSARFEQEATVNGFELFYNGHIPAVKIGKGSVHGEIYDIPDNMWEMLDTFEGVSIKKAWPGYYDRLSTLADGVPVQIYVGNNCFNHGNWREVRGGDFKTITT